MSAPPSIVRLSCSGLMTIPGSTAMVYVSTVIFPVLGTTETWQTHAQYVFDLNIADTPCPLSGVVLVADAPAFGDLRVCQPDASWTAFNTPINRASVVCLRRNSIGSM